MKMSIRARAEDLYSITDYLVQLSLPLDCWPNSKTLVWQDILLPGTAEPTRALEVLREDGGVDQPLSCYLP